MATLVFPRWSFYDGVTTRHHCSLAVVVGSSWGRRRRRAVVVAPLWGRHRGDTIIVDGVSAVASLRRRGDGGVSENDMTGMVSLRWRFCDDLTTMV